MFKDTVNLNAIETRRDEWNTLSYKSIKHPHNYRIDDYMFCSCLQYKMHLYSLKNICSMIR